MHELISIITFSAFKGSLKIIKANNLLVVTNSLLVETNYCFFVVRLTSSKLHDFLIILFITNISSLSLLTIVSSN